MVGHDVIESGDVPPTHRSFSTLPQMETIHPSHPRRLLIGRSIDRRPPTVVGQALSSPLSL